MFNIERETRFDLRFRLFGTPIRITPWFWLATVASGFNLVRDVGIEYLLIWVVCVLFSITLHEFGHIWMGRAFGNHGEIVLQAMCGLAVGAGGQYERWKRILVSLAGPGIQIIFSAILISALLIFGKPQSLQWNDGSTWFQNLSRWMELISGAVSSSLHVINLIFFLLQINLFWAAINLLPVWPLDGGQISREIFTKVSPQKGVRASLAISIATAIVLCIHSGSALLHGPTIPFVPPGSFFVLILFLILALLSFQLLYIENLKQTGHWRDPEDDRLPWESDPDEWKRR